MPKLSQINAVVAARKSSAEREISDLYKIVQKDDLFSGRERIYRPLDVERGQQFPPESQRVQQRATDVLDRAKATWAERWDGVFTQDVGNTTARVDLVVDGKVMLPAVPVTFLLFLDKQLTDVETFVTKLPTPAPTEEWNQDTNSGLLRTKPADTIKTSKEPVPVVKYPATAEHPAQTELFTKDVLIGHWSQTLYSGAMSADRRSAILAKVRQLRTAVKMAREEANSKTVDWQKAGAPVFDYLLG